MARLSERPQVAGTAYVIEHRLALIALDLALSKRLAECRAASADAVLDFAAEQLERVAIGEDVLLRACWAARAVLTAADLPSVVNVSQSTIRHVVGRIEAAADAIVSAAPMLPAFELRAGLDTVAKLVSVMGRKGEDLPPEYSADDLLDQVDHIVILIDALDAEQRRASMALRRGVQQYDAAADHHPSHGVTVH